MDILERLNEAFHEALQKRIDELNTEVEALKKKDDIQEMIKKQIQSNLIIGPVLGPYGTCYRYLLSTNKGSRYGRPSFMEYADKYELPHEKLYAAFTNTLDCFTAQAKEKAEKDQQFGKTEDCEKEIIKMNTFQEVKILFIETYEKFYGGFVDGSITS